MTVVMPAFNEERHIANALKPLVAWRDSHPNKENIHLLVVSDGSTDRTVEIARKAGVEVIPSDPKDPYKNLGKADAVRAAARHARDVHKSDVLVTLDADTTRFSGNGIEALALPVSEGKYHMTVSDTTEGWQISRPESGSRGFFLPALNP